MISSSAKHVHWTVLPAPGSGKVPEPITISRDRIRRTVYARNKVRADFPRVLDRVVGDVDNWTVQTDKRLEVLKSAVHAGKSLPDIGTLLRLADVRRSTRKFVEDAVSRDEDLLPLLTSLIWVHWDNPRTLNASVKIAVERISDFRYLRSRMADDEWLILSLQCVQLLADDDNHYALNLLANPAIWTTPLTSGSARQELQRLLNALRKGWESEPSLLEYRRGRPEPKLPAELIRRLDDLVALGRSHRKSASGLLERMVTPDLIAGWTVWWRQFAELESEVLDLVKTRGEYRGRTLKERCKSIRERLDVGQERIPRIHARGLFDCIFDIAKAVNPGVSGAIDDCLSEFPESMNGIQDRIDFAANWQEWLADPGITDRLKLRLLKAQNSLLRSVPKTESHLGYVANSLINEMAGTWIDDTKPKSQIEPVIDAVAELLSLPEPEQDPLPLLDRHWDTVVECAELLGDPEHVSRAIDQVPPDYSTIHGEAWITFLKIAGGEINRFRAIVGNWPPDSMNTAIESELARLAGQAGPAAIIAESLAAGEGKRVRRIIEQSSMAGLSDDLQHLPPTDPAEEPDLTIYPAELHDELLELARWDPDYGKAADKILGDDFPLRSRIEDELRALRKLIEAQSSADTTALRLRESRLRRRLMAPRNISAGRLENLRAKLKSRIRHAKLKRWESHLKSCLQDRVEARIGAVPVRQWFDNGQHLLVISAIADLGPGSQKLAYRILKARCGPSPWDLRQEPANRAFIRKIANQGVDIEPWLDGIGQRTLKVGRRKFTIGLETDPLEIMAMGAPFNTCLAPGSFNYFSAVSNAADVNKRVIYVRDARGAIVGRCLIALTDRGDIVSFYFYCNEAECRDDIDSAVTTFLSDLAAAMRSMLVPSGLISNLVSQDWYDDGPVDRTGQFGFLQADSQFRKGLRQIPPDDLIAAVQAELGGRSISPSVVIALFGTSEIKSRPELVSPLLPYLGDTNLLDLQSLMIVIPIVNTAGMSELVLELLLPLVKNPPRPIVYDQSMQQTIADLLIDLGRPSIALRLLRRTRPYGVRRWRDEWSGTRVFSAARAFVSLKRPVKAIELYRLAADKGHRDARSAAQSLAAELGLQ